MLTTREHIIALEPRGKGLMGALLRYPYEVRDEADYFEDIPKPGGEGDARSRKAHVQSKAGHFEPDNSRTATRRAREVINRKAKGEKIEATKPERPSNVINLMDALKQSLAAERGEKAPASAHGAERRPKRRGRKSPHPLKLQGRSESRLEAGWRSRNPPWIKRSCGLNRTTAPGCTPCAVAQHAHRGLISTSISCAEVQFSAERGQRSTAAASAPTLTASCV